MTHRTETRLTILVFVTVSLIGSGHLAQATPQVGQLAQSIRSELAAGGRCGTVLREYLARMALRIIPNEHPSAEAASTGFEPAKGSSCEDVVGRLARLQSGEQVELARALAEDSNALISSLGANLLFKHGQEDEAARAFAKGIASGQRDRMYFAPSHKGDQTVWGRTMVKISRHLLANLESYSGAERQHVEQFLSMWTSTIPFSRAEAERRIKELESELGKKSPGAKSP